MSFHVSLQQNTFQTTFLEAELLMFLSVLNVHTTHHPLALIETLDFQSKCMKKISED